MPAAGGMTLAPAPITQTREVTGMTVGEAIAQIRELKPNPYTDELLVRQLNNLDLSIYNELYLWHEGLHTVDEETGETVPQGPPGFYDIKQPDTPLLVPEPYSELYGYYLAAQIDFLNGELARYNNSMVMYNTALSTYADYVNRTRMPLHRAAVRT